MTYELKSLLMNDGWNSKTTRVDNVIKCTMDKNSIVFKFHISRFTLQIEVVKNWCLTNVCFELVFDLGPNGLRDFTLWIIEGGHVAQKVHYKKRVF